MISILVAEASKVLLLGIKSVFGTHGEFVLSAEISEKEQLLQSLMDMEFDVAMIELAFFKSIKTKEFADLRKTRPDLRFLVHSHRADLDEGVDAIRRGALGYLSKHCSPAELINAIVTVYRGKPFISESMGAALADKIFLPSNISHVSLSERERKVFRMLAVGISLTGIAAQLDLSVKTVSTYKSRILEKMGFPGLSELVQYAISYDLLNYDSGEDQDNNSSWAADE